MSTFECRLGRDAAMSQATPLDNIFITEYMSKAPEGFVRAYIYGLMQCRYPQLSDDMCDALRMTPDDIHSAFSYWQKEGLVRVLSTEPLSVEYMPASMQLRRQSPAPERRYAQLYASLSEVMGTRALTGAELSRIVDWIEVFGLDEDAAVSVASYCLSLKGARVSVAYMDKIARDFADCGAVSRELAEAEIARRKALSGGAAKLLERWNTRRPPTEDELLLYRKWTGEWGFSEEAIIAESAKTTAASRPSFKYMDGILEALRTAGGLSDREREEYQRNVDYSRELARLMLERAGSSRAPKGEQREECYKWHFEWGVPVEVMLTAAEDAKSDSRPWQHMRRLINDWYSAGIKTVASANADIDGRKRMGVIAGKKPSALDYSQRKYDPSQLDGIIIDVFGGEND